MRLAAAEDRSGRTVAEATGAVPGGTCLRVRAGRLSRGSPVFRTRSGCGRSAFTPAARTTEVVGGGGLGRVLRSAAVGGSMGRVWPGAFDGGAGAFTPGRCAPPERGFPVFPAFPAEAFPVFPAFPVEAFPVGAFPAGDFPPWLWRPAGILITGISPAAGSGFGPCFAFDPGLRRSGSDVFSKTHPFGIVFRALPGSGTA